MQVGPQLPQSVLRGRGEPFGGDEASQAIERFLDQQVLDKDIHSVLYIG
jgi:hypothetical protein